MQKVPQPLCDCGTSRCCPARTRTLNLLLQRQALCQLSYRAIKLRPSGWHRRSVNTVHLCVLQSWGSFLRRRIFLFAESLRSRYTDADLAHKPYLDFGTRILVSATATGSPSLCFRNSICDSRIACGRHRGRVYDGWKSGHRTE